jgi:hypothetical protein
MRLLVSVANAAEALAALDGGADLIDAKDPRTGALGAVSIDVLHDIHAAIAGRRPITAALGDADDEATIQSAAATFAAAGAMLVKIGFAGIADARRIAALTTAAGRGAGSGSDRGSGIVAVAYADADRVASLPPGDLVDVAARAGARGVLVDTANKRGDGLRQLVTRTMLASWVAEAHANGLFVALAGKLTADDLPFVRDTGADIVGVRGAACSGGRRGRVEVHKVRLLQHRLREHDQSHLLGQ